jgi:hypothetical protein
MGRVSAAHVDLRDCECPNTCPDDVKLSMIPNDLSEDILIDILRLRPVEAR